jgi:cytochrome c oxidase subunit 1
VVWRDGEFPLPVSQRNLIRWTIYIGFAALTVGVAQGLAQALNYAHIDLFHYYPGMRSYYEGLTVHGVLNAIVLTFAFANGFIALTMARGLGRPLSTGLLWLALGALALGSALAGIAMFSGHASVLYTFYPPLQASWPFYLGLALIVVSTWVTSINLFVTLHAWRREHPGERIPLLAYMSVMVYVFWDISSVGVAGEVVGMLLPWSLGLTAATDPMLGRSLFWLTGHPIVYFWLLPVYVSWYAMIPRQVGGVLFSDSIVRVVFLMFLLIIPIGFHHQFVDPGLSPGFKFLIAVMTFMVFLPSLLTAFSVMYSLEIGGRHAGGTGLIGWFFAIPWRDPSVCAQVLAMLAFLLGGITGIMNASYEMNLEIHNTAFVPGHFHMTVGAAVALSYMGIAYWLVPYFEQRKLWGARLACWQAWIYFIGVLIFARGMISGGLAGMPRRTAIALVTYPLPESWKLAGILIGIGGALMFVGAVLFFFVLFMTTFFSTPAVITDIPFTATFVGPEPAGWQPRLDRLGLWAGLAIAITLVIYGPFLAHHLPPRAVAMPFRAY